MNTDNFVFIVLSLIYHLLLSFGHKFEKNILDISDYTFHYKTYHYSLDFLSTATTTIYNDDLQTNITIHFTDTISVIIDNNQTINILNDNEWNEISLISSIQSIQDEFDSEEDHEANRRTLLRRRRRRKKRRGGRGGNAGREYNGVRHGRKWRDAKNYCKISKRGILATIHSAGENNKVSRECAKMGRKWHCWIGLRRPFQKWIDGSNVDYTAWMPGEPNNWGGNEDCTEVYSERFKWNDLKCGHGRAFVCQRKSASRGKKGKCGCGCGYGCKGKRSRRAKRRRRRNRKKWARIKRYDRQRKRQRRRRRAARRKMRKRNAARRKKWRAKLRAIRRKKRDALKVAYQREMRLEHRRNSAFNLLNKLIGSALRHSGVEGGTQRFGQIGEFLRRRRLGDHVFDDDDDDDDIEHDYDMISRCKIINGKGYEICINYNFGYKFLSIDIKFVDRKEFKDIGENRINYRGHMMHLQQHDENDVIDVSDYQIIETDKNSNDIYAIFDPIEATLGFTVWKYDSMDWHSFHDGLYIDYGDDVVPNKREYGQFNKFDNYVHYFQEFELEYNNKWEGYEDDWDYINKSDISYGDINYDEYIECSIQFEHLPFKMCMKQIKNENDNTKDTVLYFEKDINDEFDINGQYSFQVKEYIDNLFENNIFYFNNNDDWDEIIVIESNLNMNWIKKCNHKLLIGKVCIEQFDINDSRGSIKFQSTNRYILSS